MSEKVAKRAARVGAVVIALKALVNWWPAPAETLKQRRGPH